MLQPKSVYQSIQYGNDEDKAEHLHIDEDPEWVPDRKINPVDLISSFLKKIWYTEQKLFLPTHTLAVGVQLPGIVEGGDHGGYSEEHAHLGKRFQLKEVNHHSHQKYMYKKVKTLP